MAYRLNRYGWIEYGEKRGLQKGREQGLQTGLEKGREERREQGLQKGREEQNKEVVLNLLKEGTDLAFICKVTGLSEREILKIKN